MTSMNLAELNTMGKTWPVGPVEMTEISIKVTLEDLDRVRCLDRGREEWFGGGPDQDPDPTQGPGEDLLLDLPENKREVGVMISTMKVLRSR